MYQRERLFARLGQFAYRTFADATRLCRTFRHECVELEHWLSVLSNQEHGDFPLLCKHYNLDQQRIAEALNKILHTTPNRSSIATALSSRVENAVEKGMLISQLIDDSRSVRTAHILLGLLNEPAQQRWLYRISDEFKKLPLPRISDECWDIITHSIENDPALASDNPVIASPSPQPTDEILLKWCSDLTQLAREGQIDAVIGRETELRQLIDILQRRRQNNPILVGEAGVGKTAVVEALAQQMVSDSIPSLLKNARLLSLDLARMQAGANVRGEFESRLKTLIDTIKRSEHPIILFCDEAHTLVGAGGDAGTGDAVNLLKPMLARGELRMIAATTWSEYKQFIEPDAALTRRFQPVLIAEPDEACAVKMLRAIAPKFSQHHNVLIREPAIHAAVRLSMRNLPARQLPDKAISLLDTACARVALSHHCQPLAITECVAEIAAITLELENLVVEDQFNATARKKINKLEQKIREKESQLQALQLRHATETEQLSHFFDFDNQQIRDSEKLAAFSFEETRSAAPLVYPWVDEYVIAEVLSDWTGIPSGRMLQSDIDSALQLESHLATQIFGQQDAIKEIAQAVRIARAGIQSQHRPLGVFMLTGPTGTGKTETATALVEAMYGGSHQLITFNMSEFQEAHSVSTLKGAPPGYVGYGKGGKLTEAVRRKPWSVILLDEFEKAHPDIHDIFYQVFDKGVMEDGEGRQVSFRHCFIILTCNAGAEEIENAAQAGDELKISTLRPRVHDALSRIFTPAFIARMNIIPYLPLSDDAIKNIANKYLQQLTNRLNIETGAKLKMEGDIETWVTERIKLHPSRGRAVENLLNQTVLPLISNEILMRQRDGKILREIRLTVTDGVLTLDFD